MRTKECKFNGDFVLQLAIVLDTPMSARMIPKWTGSTAHWTSTVTTKEVACVRTVETTLRVSTVIDANLATFAHLARAWMKQMFVIVSWLRGCVCLIEIYSLWATLTHVGRWIDGWTYLCDKANWDFYAFFWVIPRRLNFICWCFGTLCLYHLHRQVGVKNFFTPTCLWR